jgi:putative membrane protein
LNTQWLLAATHLTFFAVLFGSIVARSRALTRLPRSDANGARDLGTVFAADNLWGLAATVMLVSGAVRAFAGFEKGSAYYLHQPMFQLKMACLAAILLLEVWPMIALIGWRLRSRKGAAPDISRAGLFARISAVQAALVIAMAIAASAMARGVG